MKTYEKLFIEINRAVEVIVTSPSVTTGRVNVFGNSATAQNVSFLNDIGNSDAYEDIPD